MVNGPKGAPLRKVILDPQFVIFFITLFFGILGHAIYISYKTGDLVNQVSQLDRRFSDSTVLIRELSKCMSNLNLNLEKMNGLLNSNSNRLEIEVSNIKDRLKRLESFH